LNLASPFKRCHERQRPALFTATEMLSEGVGGGAQLEKNFLVFTDHMHGILRPPRADCSQREMIASVRAFASRSDRFGGCGAVVSMLIQRLNRGGLSVVGRIVRPALSAMDRETEYLPFFGMKEHRAAGATNVINRMIACDNSRWSVDRMDYRGRWNDRETYLWVHGSLLAPGPPHLGALSGALRTARYL
jgi:hypothetical protein